MTKKEYGDYWRSSRKEAGYCISCGKPKGDVPWVRCYNCTTTRDKAAALKRHAQKSKGLCVTCDNPPDPGGTYCGACKKKHRAIEKSVVKGLRKKAIEFLGGKCACCGESSYLFLTIDHINRDGHKERKQTNQKRSWYRKILKGEREDLRVLCFNCNCGRELNEGVCPHETEKD